MTAQADYDDDNEYDFGCGNCGGEGFTFDCYDGCCEDADVGCDLCTRRCSWCNPGKSSPELQQILADALAETQRVTAPPSPGQSLEANQSPKEPDAL